MLKTLVLLSAAAAAASAVAAALAVEGQEGMLEGLLQTDALSWVVLHHLLYQVKQLLMVFTLRHHVMLTGKDRTVSSKYVIECSVFSKAGLQPPY